MGWCLDCHRNPERAPAPARARDRDGLGARRGPARARPAASRGRATSTRRRTATHVIADPEFRPTYWRSLDELAETPEFRGRGRARVPRRRPGTASTPATRRSFLKVMGASLAWPASRRAAGRRRRSSPSPTGPRGACPACRSTSPRRWSSAASPLGAAGHQLRRPADQGRRQPRPPGQPRRRRAVAQARVLELYDPDRSRSRRPQRTGGRRSPRSWDDFAAWARDHFAALSAERRRGPRGARRGLVVAEPARLRERLLAAHARGRRGTSTSRVRATTSGRARGWPSAARCGPSPHLERGRRGRRASTPTCCGSPRARSRTPASFAERAAPRRERHDEPALRRRERA